MDIVPALAHIAAIGLLLLPPAPSRAQQPSSGLQQQALAEAQAGNTEAAIRDYTLALQNDPGWREGWWNLGALQYSANRFADAQRTFTRVTTFAPGLGTAWALLGLSEFETHAFPQARQHLETALRLGIPDDDETRRVATYHLALLLIRDSSFTAAADLLRPTSSAANLSPQAQFALGLATLRIPLLPAEVDPSHEALIAAAGALAAHPDEAAAPTQNATQAPTPIPTQISSQIPAFLAAYPDTPFAHYAAALLLAHTGHPQQALADLRAETRISPASPLPWQEISRLEQQLGHPAAAREAASKAAALPAPPTPDPRIRALYALAPTPPSTSASSPALWSAAMQSYAAGGYTDAIAALKPLLQAQPSNGTGWAVLGLSEYALHDPDDARIHLERGEALGLNGSPQALRDARYTLGLLYLRSGDFSRATSVLKRTPDDPDTRLALGLALLRRSQSPQDLPAADRPLVTTAGQVAALLEASRYDQALPLLQSLVAQHPAMPVLHDVYGTALLSLSEFDPAAAQFRAETALTPGNPLPWLRLASVALRQHTPAEALAPARKALALTPNSADAHYLLGRALLETGDDPAALHELEIAGKLSPGSPEVHFNLAKAYARARMPEAAAAERATFAQLNQQSELQKSRSGNTLYTGPRDTADSLTTPTAPPQP